MPYIEPSDRAGARDIPVNAGELSFNIAKTVMDYLNRKGESYQTYNDIIGVMECIKLEIYRRCVVPYEETKRSTNGDVFTWKVYLEGDTWNPSLWSN